MFTFDLNKTQVWVALALILLSFSICPHSSHPYGEDDEDPDSGKDYESALGDEEGEDFIENTQVENAPADCIQNFDECTTSGKPCCDSPSWKCQKLGESKENFCLDMTVVQKLAKVASAAALPAKA